MSSNEIDEKKLQLAWTLILSQFRHLAEKTSREGGPGINMFKMLLSPRPSGANCDYRYAEQNGAVWNLLLDHSPLKERILKIYDPDKMYLIAVFVPIIKESSTAQEEETIQNIRIFQYMLPDGSLGPEIIP